MLQGCQQKRRQSPRFPRPAMQQHAARSALQGLSAHLPRGPEGKEACGGPEAASVPACHVDHCQLDTLKWSL